VTIPQFIERHTWATKGGLRLAVFHGAANGFDACVVRFGRRVLLDEAAVLEWMRSRGGKPISLSDASDPAPSRRRRAGGAQ